MSEYDLIIIGAGPAGLTAALYASRSGLRTLAVDKGAAGGQIATTAEIENWPGTESTTGPGFTERLAAHARKFGAEITEFTEVVSLELEGKTKKVKTANGGHEAKAVIIATGAREKKLGIKGEVEFKGKGVSYCAMCDGSFFRSKSVAVIGGGNSALSEAIYLSKFASSVTVVHRRSEFRAEKALVEQAKGNPRIKFLLDSVPEEISGAGKVEKMKVKNAKTGAITDLKADGVFIYVGMLPNSELVKAKLKLDDYGQIVVDREMKTSIKGVFAAGDVTNSRVKQVTTAAADGTIAAVSAEKYLSGT